MQFSAQQIAGVLNGKIEGDPHILVSDFSKIESGKPGTLTFLANLKYSPYIYETKASIVLVNDDFTPEKKLPETVTLIRVPDAYAALGELLKIVNEAKPKKSGIESMSFVHPSAKVEEEGTYIGAFAYVGEGAKIGKNVAIYPNTFIGDNVVVDDNTIIYSGVNIYHDCKIGKNCIIHSGAVIGSDGFGFAKQGEAYSKIPQLGNVVLEDDVEIGANTTIDRAVMESTIIRKGVKLDNLIQIAHNVEVGENTAMAAQVGVSGSTKIGKNCMLAGQVGLGGHIKLGDNVTLGAQSGCISNIESGKTLLGSPPIEVRNFFQSSVIFSKLPDMYRTLNQLQKEIESLKTDLQKDPNK